MQRAISRKVRLTGSANKLSSALRRMLSTYSNNWSAIYPAADAISIPAPNAPNGLSEWGPDRTVRESTRVHPVLVVLYTVVLLYLNSAERAHMYLNTCTYPDTCKHERTPVTLNVLGVEMLKIMVFKRDYATF